MTRGIRNNNPLNIRKGSNWKGLSNVQSDKSFCQFVSIEYGIRAALIVLRTYAYKYKLHSLKDVISRFAPSSDGNNVDNYIYRIRCNFMSNLPADHVYHNINEDTMLNLWWNKIEPKPVVFYLLRAMAMVESYYHLDYETYKKAVSLL